MRTTQAGASVVPLILCCLLAAASLCAAELWRTFHSNPNEEEQPMASSSSDYAQMLVSEVNMVEAGSGIFLSSPSLVRLDDGTLLVSHDYSGPNSPHRKTSLYRSDDNGSTWTHVVMLDGIYWASLFVHQGDVYLLGTSGPLESIVIRKSEDQGATWTTAADAQTGLLFPGSYGGPISYHTAPTAVLRANVRIYKAFESNAPYVWPQNFKSFVISAPEDADLLRAENWTKTNELAYDPAWAPADWGSTRPGWLEGNMVQAPNGDIWNIIRLNSEPVTDKAAMIRLSADNQTVSFDPATGFIDFPGGMHKSTIRYDETSGLYIALVNPNIDPGFVQQRNVLAMYTSRDLRQWQFAEQLIQDDSGWSVPYSIAKVGFQYADWQFVGDDILFVARTSYDGADTYHNANRITFHRLQHARAYMDMSQGYWTFDEATGTSASDSAIHHAAGTVHGANWTDGYRNGALAFDGMDDFVQIDPAWNAHLQGASAISMAGWFRNNGLPASGAGQWLFHAPIGQTESGADMRIVDGHIRVGGRSKPNENYKYRDFPFSAGGEWHHAVGILDYARNDIRLYLDGVEQQPVPSVKLVFGNRVYTPEQTSGPATIGGSLAGIGSFDGVLDDIRIYDRVLRPEEIQQLVYDSLVGYWRPEAAPYEIADRSRRGNNGKRMGTSLFPDEPQSGVRLDGSADYIHLGYQSSSALTDAPAITVAAWFQDKNVFDANPKWLFGTRIHGGSAGAELTLTGTAIRVAGRSDRSDSLQTASFPYTRQEGWQLAVGILDFEHDTIRLFLNGVELTPANGSVSFHSSTYKRLVPSQADAIGRSPAGSGYFGGEIGDVLLLRKALSAIEIEHLYRTGGDDRHNRS